jgi:lysophospholipase L1-like esterase
MKALAWNIGATALLALVALAGMEAYLHSQIPPMREGTLFEYRLDSKRYKVMKPNVHMKIYGADVRTNNLGFRDKRAAIPQKKPGEFRIIVLGDSFTFGPGVPYEHIYTSLLDARLKRTYPQVSVINLAVEGYNIIQYEAVLEDTGLALQPDAVLVSMFPVNDFEMDVYDTNRRIAAGNPPRPAPWYEELYVYRAYLYHAEQVATKVMHKLIAVAAAGGPDEGWDKNTAALRQIADIAQAHNLPLLVALLPHTKGFNTQRAMFAPVNAYCQAQRLVCLDLLEAFRESGVRDGALVLNAVDGHPNEEYNRIIAEQLTPALATLVARHTPPAAPALLAATRP